MEDSPRVRHHLPGLGLDVSGNPGWRSADAAIPHGRHPLLSGRIDSLRMDACEWGTIAYAARVARCNTPWIPDVLAGLRLPVLGRAASSFRDHRGGDRAYSCVHYPP